MGYLTKSVPAKWVMLALVATAAAITFRAHDVLATMNDAEADQFLDLAHEACVAGDYKAALSFAQQAVEISPETPEALSCASDYAFLLGMSKYGHAKENHLDAFNAGLYYSTRAHRLAPADANLHRQWAESLLLAYFYDVPVSRVHIKESWRTLPVASEEDRAYRDTAMRIVSNPKID